MRKALLKVAFERNARLQQGLLSRERSEHILQVLHARIAAEQAVTAQAPVKHFSSYTRIAAAAIIILLATVTGAYMYWHRGAALATSEMTVEKSTLIAYVNKENAPQSLTLPDSSMVKVWPGSAISYYNAFTATSRTISLKGKAVFEVAKDAARPFTVFAGEIATTALGTVFMVNTLDERKVQVQLYEGKVVIRSVAQKLAMKEVYLKAGEQFEINKTGGQVSVSPISDDTAATSHKTKPLKNNNSKALEFNQTPLTEVLASVGARYHVRFKFRNGDFNKMYVTGKFLPTDSLPVVLRMLGTIYRLNFKQQNNTIEVTGK